MKKALLAWLAGLLTTVALTFLFHRLMMGDQFDAAYEKLGNPNRALMLIVYAIVVAVTVYLYRLGRKSGSPPVVGYRVGAAVGLVFITPVAMLFQFLGVPVGTIVPDVLWHTFVEHALAGLVIGVVYGRE